MDRREHVPAETKYVYILGAGASYADDSRLPLLRSVFKSFEEPRDGLKTSWADRYSTLHKWLKDQYSSYQTENIEEVLTYLDYLRSNFVFADNLVEQLNIEITKVYLELIDYLQKILNPIEEGKNLQLHSTLVKRLKPFDSIISFNYDEVIDSTLVGHNAGNTDGERLPQLLNLQYLISKVSNKDSLFNSLGTGRTAEAGHGILLKLHGSLFWTSCTHFDCPNRFYIGMSNEDHLIVDEEGYYNNAGFNMFPEVPSFCGLCGNKLERVFIYPTAYKQFSVFPKIRVLWQEAHRVLSSATHFVIIGYSLPDTDFQVKNLIRHSCYSGKGRSWRIVDPNWKDVLCRLKPLIEEQSHSVTFFLRCYEGFTQYLKDEFVEEVDHEYFWNLNSSNNACT